MMSKQDAAALREIFRVRQRRVDLTIPASVGSVSLQTEGSRGLWLHSEEALRSAPARLTPPQARLLASVLIAYADSHPDTEET